MARTRPAFEGGTRFLVEAEFGREHAKKIQFVAMERKIGCRDFGAEDVSRLVEARVRDWI